MRPNRFPKPLVLSLLAAAAFPALGEPGGEQNSIDTIVRSVASSASDDAKVVGPQDAEMYEAAVRIVSDEAGGPSAIRSWVSSSTVATPFSASSSLNPADNQFDHSRGPSTSRTASATWSMADAQWWQPSLSYAMDEEHAVAVSAVERDAAAAVPNVPTLAAHTAVAEWSYSSWRTGYRVTSAEQRTAFSTRSAATRSSGQGTYVAVSLIGGVDLQADFSQDLVRDPSMPIAMQWQTQSVSAQWSSLDRRWNVRSGFAQSSFAGDTTIPALASQMVDMTVTYSLAGGTGMNAVSAPQIYARLNRQDVRSGASAVAASSSLTSYGVNVGISFSF